MPERREDQDFLDWLTYQPSWIDGAWNEVDEAGARRNIACHVRRAGDAGTGYKPLYSAVPMTFAQHQIQSVQGELACLQAFTFAPRFLAGYEGANDVERAKAAFDSAAVFYLLKWRKNANLS